MRNKSKFLTKLLSHNNDFLNVEDVLNPGGNRLPYSRDQDLYFIILSPLYRTKVYQFKRVLNAAVGVLHL